MYDKICSCCGQCYEERKGHDWEQCLEDCERKVALAKGALIEAQRKLEKAVAHSVSAGSGE